MSREHITSAQLAERLGVNVRTIYAWRKAGKGPRGIQPAGKSGNVLYSINDVRAWEAKKQKDVER